MFVDLVTIDVAAGNGGNGVIAWRREKYIPKGGPAGGDGGNGGSVYIYVDPNCCGLEWFRHVKHVVAESGHNGAGSCCHGKNGTDITLHIPPGTVVRDADSREVLFDGICSHETFVLCKGGKGGRGNDFFKSPTHRAPYEATDGEPGERRRVECELKLIADVGFVGFPNAGKSTLLSHLTERDDVEIGAYPFTTLTPNIGHIFAENGRRIYISDIPGIIEGAHRNKGLGLEFLRHIERTKVLLYVIDASGMEGRSPLEDYRILIRELMSYDPSLIQRPSCLVLNKCDELSSLEYIQLFRDEIAHPYIIEISARERIGLDDCKAMIEALVLSCGT